jgi:hypothetical protein
MMDDKVGWKIIARRLIPFLLLCVLLPICFFLMWLGYGKDEADRFRNEVM